ncbi:MAG: site-specific DNA-methyltransferase [Saprospirales bacterium]|nr:site-specific DNA-methyltransferase [Saprospirales bacterium]
MWQKKYSTKADSKFLSESHEYILVYAKSINNLMLKGLERTEKQLDLYKNPDNDPRGSWASDNLLRTEEREYAIFEIVSPIGNKYLPPKGSSWRFNKDKIQELLSDNRIWFGEDGNSRPRYKRFLSEVRQDVIVNTLWKFDEVGHSDSAKKETAKILNESPNVFSTPKPVRLIQRMIKISCNEDDLILDFFAGSGTVGQAVLELNTKDNGNRSFILVQMPEPIEENSEAWKAGYRDIAEIGRARVRKVIEQIQAQATEKAQSPELFKDSENLTEQILASNPTGYNTATSRFGATT